MELLVSQTVAGLATGALYASMALALVTVYRATGVINFAQGEMGMLSAYLAWALLTSGVPYWPAVGVVVLASFLGGAAIGRGFIRLVGYGSSIESVAVSIGLLLAINGTVGLVFGHSVRSFPSPFPSGPLPAFPMVTHHDAGTAAMLILGLLVVDLLFQRTRVGLNMRAAVELPATSELLGINVGRMRALGWGLAAALSGMTGIMSAPTTFLSPTFMWGVLVYGFAAAVLGGLRNPRGAVASGFCLGVLDNMIGTYLPSGGQNLRLSFGLAAVIGALLLKAFVMRTRILADELQREGDQD